jgi:hypothetical protein
MALIWSDTIIDQARLIHRHLQAQLPGELLLTGAASLPGLLTKGDVDLHLRVPPETFDQVIADLDTRYPRAGLHSWAPTLAVYDIPGFPLPTGLAVTPTNSEHDHRFTRAWSLLAADADLRTQYNALKLSSPDYESAKSTFFSKLAYDQPGDR